MEIIRTETYDRWFRKLKDVQGKARINIALRRCELAGKIVGDVKPVGNAVMELRIHTGPGYRIYYTFEGDTLMLLLIGGDKSTQQRDIDAAHKMAHDIRRKNDD
ncbi:MAG: type II toxin-antitoxin system RelE/ParE family toxin [Rothia sp. (in: high G+C Gram-positive bacteria)]|uniref:type II toxin-antitoxin system RelE/ParE family toxin n=1 Tax=Rothia sp. (in: high G+C Gram-positive bacteria) TaxID=1885016 RepID=UPI0026DEBDEA|nr:type II toxin-antitoxin system RelE/ParE family toxin [Rothia sp. (in: high G+C Gram-positive bacteria)]MDO5751057.1 type II toxin-antitoxin system RelE/ParE family toxin [Rothia sp. (in: high G+C Gram-positive bacteria)]